MLVPPRDRQLPEPEMAGGPGARNGSGSPGGPSLARRAGFWFFSSFWFPRRPGTGEELVFIAGYPRLAFLVPTYRDRNREPEMAGGEIRGLNSPGSASELHRHFAKFYQSFRDTISAGSAWVWL